MEQFVFIVDTGTTKFIEIKEPGSQQQIRKIACSLSEGEMIMQQLANALYQSGYYKRPPDLTI